MCLPEKSQDNTALDATQFELQRNSAVPYPENTQLLGTVTLANGTALFTTSALSVGTHSITASYAGDFNFVPLTSAVLSQNVNADANFAVSNSPVSEVVPGAIVKLFPTSINFGT